LSEQDPNEQPRGEQPAPGQQPPWGTQPQRAAAPPPDGRQPPWGAHPQGNTQQPSYGTQPPWDPQQPSNNADQPPWGAQPPEYGTQPQWGAQPQWNAPPHWNPQQSGYANQPGYVAPPKPGIVPLRPLMFGEILDGSFQTIRRNAKAMLGAALLAQTLGTIVVAVFTAEAGSQGESLGLWVESLTPSDMAGMGLGLIAAAILLETVSVFISAVLQGVMVVPVARSVLNWRTGFKEMWSLSRSRIGSLLGLGALLILATVAVGAVLVGGSFLLADAMGGMAALIIVPLFLGTMVAVVLLYIRFLVAPAAIVVEELGVLDGLRRSWQLTRHNWWRIFGITLVISLLIGIIGQIVLIPITFASAGLSSVVAPHSGDDGQRALAVGVKIASIVVSALVGAVAYAFQTSVMGLLYMDLRMRKEGLDLALLRLLESGEGASGVPGRGIAPGGHAGSAGAGGWPQSPYGPPPGAG
jgi:hypothetical protein